MEHTGAMSVHLGGGAYIFCFIALGASAPQGELRRPFDFGRRSLYRLDEASDGHRTLLTDGARINARLVREADAYAFTMWGIRHVVPLSATLGEEFDFLHDDRRFAMLYYDEQLTDTQKMHILALAMTELNNQFVFRHRA